MTHPAAPSLSLKWRAALIAVALLVTSLPAIYGCLNSKPGFVYTGMKGLNATDFNANLAWIEQGRHGRFLFRNLYSHEFQQGFMIRPVYFLISLPFGLTSLPNGAVYHVQRLFCGLALLWSLFALLSRYISERKTIWIAFALLAFSSGLGFLLRTQIDHPIDLVVPEAMLFLALGEAPHFVYCLLLLWAGATGFFVSWRDGWRLPSLALLCLFILWWEHPYDALTLSAIGGIAALFLPAWKDRARAILAVAAAAVLPAIYYRYLYTLPAFAGWAAQNVLATPSVWSLLSAYAPLVLLAIPGAVSLSRTSGKKTLLFLCLWIGVQILLAYLPFTFQRRTLAGLQFPLAILAASGLAALRRPLLIAGCILLTAAGSVWSTRQQIQELRSVQMPFYLPQDYVDVFLWMRTREPGVVLSGYVTGNFIPAWTGFPVYLGHSIQTMDIAGKRKSMAGFFAQSSADFLEREQIKYIFFGREERSFAPPGFENRFRPLYSRNGITILSSSNP